MASKDQSPVSTETDFEFIKTPDVVAPTFEKFEECGVKTTSVSTLSTAERRSRVVYHKNN